MTHVLCSSDRPFQDKFVELLRLLLLWDPKARGGAMLDSGKRECFDMLKRIINTVVIPLNKTFDCFFVL